MTKDSYNVIGVMSGTSLDGIDLAHLSLSFNGKWSFEIGVAETVAYDPQWLSRLKDGISLDPALMANLDADYTKLLGSTISDFIEKHQLSQIDAVCSHGHTIWHQPQKGLTLQIGNRPELASLTNLLIVGDFRVQDVEFGGQGAPLVPIGDRLLFPEYDFCLNLGGFSNISFEENGQRIASDICPVNTVLNHYAEELGYDFDDRGRIASSGKIIPELLEALEQLGFYKTSGPKSLGMEFVRDAIFSLTSKYRQLIPDLLCTFCEHISLRIASALPEKKGKMIVTGGGAYHDFLMGRIGHHLPQMQVVIPSEKILEFKEALIFGLLGVLKLRGEINVLSSVTGARCDHSSGRIMLPHH